MNSGEFEVGGSDDDGGVLFFVFIDVFVFSVVVISGYFWKWW